MSSIAQQVHEIASTDALVLEWVEGDTDRLRGHPTLSPDADVDGMTAPWAALKFNARVPAGVITSGLSVSDTAQAGEWEWWLYDDKQAGYARLWPLADALIASYASYFNTPDSLTGGRARLFDSDTGASVWGVQVGLPSGELADPLTTQRMLRVRWTYRTRYARPWN